MAVEKFRSVADMPRLPRVTGERLAEAIAEAWEWGQIRGARSIVRGVRRFRTMEDAQIAERVEVARHVRGLTKR